MSKIRPKLKQSREGGKISWFAEYVAPNGQRYNSFGPTAEAAIRSWYALYNKKLNSGGG